MTVSSVPSVQRALREIGLIGLRGVGPNRIRFALFRRRIKSDDHSRCGILRRSPELADFELEYADPGPGPAEVIHSLGDFSMIRMKVV